MPSHTSASQPPSPPDNRSPSPFPDTPPDFSLLSDDDKGRIDTWFDHDSRLPEIAKELDTNVLELAAWSNQPHIRQAFAFIKQIAHERTDTLQAEADHQALNRLLSIARFSNHEETARRAAMNVLTWRRPSRHRAAAPKPLPEGGVGAGSYNSGTPATDPASHPKSASSPFQISDTPLPPRPLSHSSPTLSVSAVNTPPHPTPTTPQPNIAASSFQTSNLKLPSSRPCPIPPSVRPHCLGASVVKSSVQEHDKAEPPSG